MRANLCLSVAVDERYRIFEILPEIMWTFACQNGISAERGVGDQTASLINFEEEKNDHTRSEGRNLTFVV